MKSIQQKQKYKNDLFNPQKMFHNQTKHVKTENYQKISYKISPNRHFNKLDFNSCLATPSSKQGFNKKMHQSQNNALHSQRNNSQSPDTNGPRIHHSTVCDYKRFDVGQTPKNMKKRQLINFALALRTSDSTQGSVLEKSRCFQDRINDYKMIRLLGKGRFGEVYLSVHKGTGFIGALKIIQKSEFLKYDTQYRQKMIKQLICQIKIQACLKHPNIIQLYDFFHDTQRIYLFLQLGTDGHLLDLCAKKKKLQEETTSIIIREVTKGIHYLHEKKIIHRDIKLENIVLTCGMAKICDFGWATYEPKSLRSTICGTPLYLSPEILKGKKYNDKIDIWAIGTLTHQIALGDSPFGIKKREDLSKIVTKDFQMASGSPQLKSFVTFILRKDPQKRPDAQILLKHPFITKYKNIQTSEQICQITHS